MANDILDQAIHFAVNAHAGQLRKDGSPFILHPLEDAAIVSTMTTDRNTLAAAVLHDTVEDTEVTIEEIAAQFGPRVHELVLHETEDKRPTIPPEDTWQVRKEESLAVLAASDDPAVKMLWLGDKLSNIRDLRRSYEKVGAAAFDLFNNVNPLAHKWYYGSVLELLQELRDYPAYQEYAACYHAVFDHFVGEYHV